MARRRGASYPQLPALVAALAGYQPVDELHHTSLELGGTSTFRIAVVVWRSRTSWWMLGVCILEGA